MPSIRATRTPAPTHRGPFACATCAARTSIIFRCYCHDDICQACKESLFHRGHLPAAAHPEPVEGPP